MSDYPWHPDHTLGCAYIVMEGDERCDCGQADNRRWAPRDRRWVVRWNNGSTACGEFPDRFNTPEEASAFSDDWVATMEGISPGTLGDYTCDVFEDPE